MLCHVVQHLGTDYFDFLSYLEICATSRVLNSSATSQEAQGQNIRRRRSCEAREGMLVALERAADLAAQTVDNSRWIPDNPLCCSKLCSFGGRTGLWVPRLSRHFSSTYLERDPWWHNARTRSHSYEASSPQRRVADRIGSGHLHFVVCCEMCSEDVKRALTIMNIARHCPKVQVILGVDEMVLPGDGILDGHVLNSGSESDTDGYWND